MHQSDISLKSIKIQVLSFLFTLSFMSLGCGSGNIEIDREGAEESVVSGPEASGLSAEAYFTSQLFSTLTKARTSAADGCATSGCHLKGAASSSAETFYQIDKASASESWNWAQVRRNRVIVKNTTFAASGSQTLSVKKNENHQSFKDWTAEEKALIDTWTGLAK